MPSDTSPPRWGIIVPVKPLAAAKTRLAPLGDDVRRRLALSFAQDVVVAALDCPLVEAVLVVTDDPDVGTALAALGATVTADGPSAGLNAALRHGADQLSPISGVAALVADLPCLQAADLTGVLAQLTDGTTGFVADLAGSGTTLLGAAPGAVLRPSYGPDSRHRHGRAGAVELAAPERLRLDVDTPGDLTAAGRLGLGAFTAAVLQAVR